MGVTGRVLIVFATVVCLSANAFAQNKVSFIGPKFGLNGFKLQRVDNLTPYSLSADEIFDHPESSMMKWGYNAGIFGVFDLENHNAVQVELILSQKGWKYKAGFDESEKGMRITYLEVPIMYRRVFDAAPMKFGPLLGIVGGYAIKKKYEAKFTNTKAFHAEAFNENDNRLEYGLVAGIYAMRKRKEDYINIDIRAGWFFSSYLDGVGGNHLAIQFSLGYALPSYYIFGGKSGGKLNFRG